MIEPLKRRSLLQSASAPVPVLPEEAIAEVAARNGFPNTAPPAVHGAARRLRQPTGRNHQFNVRLRRDTLDFIYAQANARNVPVAEVIEDMVDALKRLPQR